MNPEPLPDGISQPAGRWWSARRVVVLAGALLSAALAAWLCFLRGEMDAAERRRAEFPAILEALAGRLKNPATAEDLRAARLRSWEVSRLQESRVKWSPHLFRLAEFMGRLDYAWMDHLEISRSGDSNLLHFTVYTNSEGTDSVARFLTALGSEPWVRENFRGDEKAEGFTTELFRTPGPRGLRGRKFTIPLELRNALAPDDAMDGFHRPSAKDRPGGCVQPPR